MSSWTAASHDDRPGAMVVNVRARLSIRKGGTGGPFELLDREYSIGRSARNDVILEDPTVSGTHARIAPGPQGFTITDLGSTNGTKVNGTPLHASRVLRGGEVIGIGDAVLRYEAMEPAT